MPITSTLAPSKETSQVLCSSGRVPTSLARSSVPFPRPSRDPGSRAPYWPHISFSPLRCRRVQAVAFPNGAQ